MGPLASLSMSTIGSVGAGVGFVVASRAVCAFSGPATLDWAQRSFSSYAGGVGGEGLELELELELEA